jgi:hypothetical protein
MNIQLVKKDIEALEKALKLVEKTEHYTHFKKSNLIFDLCEAINQLKDKMEGQINFLNNLKN